LTFKNWVWYGMLKNPTEIDLFRYFNYDFDSYRYISMEYFSISYRTIPNLLHVKYISVTNPILEFPERYGTVHILKFRFQSV